MDGMGLHGVIHAGKRKYARAEAMLSKMLRAVEAQFDLDRIMLFAVAPERRTLELLAAIPGSRAPGAGRTQVSLIAPLGPLAECALAGEPRVLSARDFSGLRDGALLRRLGKASLLVPLLGRKGVHCWQEMGCKHRDCPVYGVSDRHCWLVSETHCRDGVARSLLDKLVWCLGCPAFGLVGLLASGTANPTEARKLIGSDRFRSAIDHLSVLMEATLTARALMRLNAELERRVHSATKELAGANQRLLRAERLMTTGKLAAGLAHEINNPLATISTCIQSLMTDLVKSPAARRWLKIMGSEVQRISTLAQGLRDLSQEQPLIRVETDLGALLATSIDLIETEARRCRVKMTRPRRSAKHQVLIDRARIRQVFANLLLNALQAMPDGGRLQVSLGEVAAGRGEDRMVEVAVKDSGAGMPVRILGKVFDPFFTTKASSGGIGLGLPVSLSIAEAHGGTIRASSTAGKGSVFTLRLPLLPGAAGGK